MGLIKKQNPVLQKAWYFLFVWRRRAEYDFSVNYFNWWFYGLMHRHEESFSYWHSLLFLKSFDFKDIVGKHIWNWYLPGTTIHYHCICMNEWQKKFYKSKWKAGESFPMSYRNLHIHQAGLSGGGLGSQAAAVRRLRSRFSCSENRAEMGTTPWTPSLPHLIH